MNASQRGKLLNELTEYLTGWVDDHSEITLVGEETGLHMAAAALNVLDAIQDVEKALIEDGILAPDDDD
ncbi:MAG: hypothetical protein EHM35_00210 [Planctomycetaceae bacterium]|nr:MAG: hypothetical protein EHM35_00210 [Planctomycetaceae bacterium]